MLFSRKNFEPEDSFAADENDHDLLALIDNARTDEEVRRAARLCLQRTRARVGAARAGSR